MVAGVHSPRVERLLHRPEPSRVRTTGAPVIVGGCQAEVSLPAAGTSAAHAVRAVRDVGDGQGGVVSRDQLRAAGIT